MDNLTVIREVIGKPLHKGVITEHRVIGNRTGVGRFGFREAGEAMATEDIDQPA